MTEAGLAAVGALGIPVDASGVGELMELATMKLLQSRQLDHAYGQFTLAAQLYARARHGMLSQQPCVMICNSLDV